MRFSISASLVSLALLLPSASAGTSRSRAVESAPVVQELAGRKLPPLSPGVLEELAKRNPNDVQIFHNDLNTVRAIQDSNGDPELLEQNAKRANAQLTGEIKRCTGSHCLCITFDDGPYVAHQDISAQMTNAGYKATFFVNGNNWRCIYDTPQVQSVRRSLKAGHEIAQHTWGHPDLVGLTYNQIDQQINLLETALLKVAGIVPAIIRPPYGSTNDTINKYLNEKHGLTVVTWNYSTEDADGASVADQMKVIKSIKSPTHAILLQHETVATTNSTVLPQEIKIVKQNGYVPANIQTVAQNLGINPYKIQTSYGTRDATWTCDDKLAPGAVGAP